MTGFFLIVFYKTHLFQIFDWNNVRQFAKASTAFAAQARVMALRAVLAATKAY
ncbi:hypothetical protein QN395_07900 [Undibacterium sp. RTI2.2]|uniref:hypothetical protein n=1 Tax=unclassified Undibacterium TaxID=2630295 RepID=UPI002AB3F60F|nr:MULTISPECIES: hypothetical protein [unclassified Undibacterium]MDY7539896.1 hypothetical protein [Undibacterium sp. 5I1]MEB0116407.1 hypothetical protein [Undibacterium sp. RTI2.2]MEB0230503.1 hypothetical protein [Undibacterium sp. 10I3]MEB0257201.1 hypothetical protein [Undibacterium sp. 5I1]